MVFFIFNLLLASLGLVLATVIFLVLNGDPKRSGSQMIKPWNHWILQNRIIMPSYFESDKQDGQITYRTLSKTGYESNFPPSTRKLLSRAINSPGELPRIRLKGLADCQDDFKRNIIPFRADYRQCGLSTYTPTGVSIGEIEALGDFPDYAILSGVPLPEPYKDFDVTKAKARPYRPFRWAYHQTMSLSKLEPNYWLELESTYRSRICQRQKLFSAHGPLVLDYLPGSELACKETMELALQFLTARYPSHFSLTHDSKTNTHTFHNHILHTCTPTNSTHPLRILLDHVPEDFAIMIRDPASGLYYLRAAVLCSSIGWTVATKLGLSLAEIHNPVPDYDAKMAPSMDRYFAKLPANRPIQRGSWGLEVDQPLFMPPGDPHEGYREKQDGDLDWERVHLRVDWQTLRRLPLSGGLVFNFKALFTPIGELRKEPYIPPLLHKILTEGNRDILTYKNTWHVAHKVLPLFEQWTREQEETGLIEKGWEVRTLDESPFFKGYALRKGDKVG